MKAKLPLVILVNNAERSPNFQYRPTIDLTTPIKSSKLHHLQIVTQKISSH